MTDTTKKLNGAIVRQARLTEMLDELVAMKNGDEATDALQAAYLAVETAEIVANAVVVDLQELQLAEARQLFRDAGATEAMIAEWEAARDA